MATEGVWFGNNNSIATPNFQHTGIAVVGELNDDVGCSMVKHSNALLLVLRLMGSANFI